MADYYSEHYTTTVGGTAIQDPRPKVAPGLSHAKVRYKRGSVTVAAGVTDSEQCRFFPLKTADRLLFLYFSNPGLTGTTMTADAGVYKEASDGGAVIDLDLFCAAATVPMSDLTAAAAHVDLLILGALEDEDRGKMLFQMADEGLASTVYDNDPHEQWDVVITMNTETAVTVGAELVLEAWYTSE